MDSMGAGPQRRGGGVRGTAGTEEEEVTLTLRSGEVRRGKEGSQMRSMGSCWRVEEERGERGTTWRKEGWKER